ncbi:MAG: amidohydrolase family protein [Bryobacteraceae bacterium]|nr:amidohydrolase family protein [Bryobacteraceae bacterium]
MRISFSCIAAVAVCAVGAAQERPVAFTGARLIPIAGPEVPDGALVIRNGKIVAAGPRQSTPIPQGAQTVNAAGKVIMPGLVDSHSHIGGVEGGDSSAPVQPDVRVLDAINARDATIQKAQAGGITTVNIMPGSGHLLSGQTIYCKLRDGNTIDDIVLRNADGTVAGGMKMANGTNSRRASPFPGTRAKSAALMREQLAKAVEYRDKVRKANGDPDKMPDRDLRLEGLVEVLDGKRIVHHHTHRHDDILTVLRLQKEFGFRVVLHHVSDAWAVADEIAKAGVGSSIILIDSPGGKIEAKDNRLVNGAALEKAGALVGFHTDDGITDSRLFLRMAALAVRAGMSREKALYGLTMANAKMLDLDRQVGSLEAGKDADFILLSGDPFSVYTKVLETWVDGVKVFDRTEAKDRLYAEGGYGASQDRASLYLDEEWMQ